MCIGQLPLLLRETPWNVPNVPGRPRKQHLTCFKCFLQFLATWEVTTGVWGCVHVSMTISFKGSTASLMKHGIWERIWRHLHLIVSREQAMFLYGGVLKYGYPKPLAFPFQWLGWFWRSPFYETSRFPTGWEAWRWIASVLWLRDMSVWMKEALQVLWAHWKRHSLKIYYGFAWNKVSPKVTYSSILVDHQFLTSRRSNFMDNFGISMDILHFQTGQAHSWGTL